MRWKNGASVATLLLTRDAMIAENQQTTHNLTRQAHRTPIPREEKGTPENQSMATDSPTFGEGV